MHGKLMAMIDRPYQRGPISPMANAPAVLKNRPKAPSAPACARPASTAPTLRRRVAFFSGVAHAVLPSAA